MRTRFWILLASVAFAGCATQRTSVVAPAPIEKTVVRKAVPMRDVETRYEVRSYRDANDPSVRHEAHAVYRTTRVPARVAALETEPRRDFAPVSYAPLPPSAELSAELAAQKEITAMLRTIEARMAAVERQAQSQFGTLVDQTAETMKLRQQLEEERARVRELESKMQVHASDATPATGSVATSTETKW